MSIRAVRPAVPNLVFRLTTQRIAPHVCCCGFALDAGASVLATSLSRIRAQPPQRSADLAHYAKQSGNSAKILGNATRSHSPASGEVLFIAQQNVNLSPTGFDSLPVPSSSPRCSPRLSRYDSSHTKPASRAVVLRRSPPAPPAPSNPKAPRKFRLCGTIGAPLGLAKIILPVKVSGIQLAHRRQPRDPSIQPPHARQSRVRLKIQPVAAPAADPVIRNPLEQGSVDTALQHQVFHQPAHRVIPPAP